MSPSRAFTHRRIDWISRRRVLLYFSIVRVEVSLFGKAVILVLDLLLPFLLIPGGVSENREVRTARDVSVLRVPEIRATRRVHVVVPARGP